MCGGSFQAPAPPPRLQAPRPFSDFFPGCGARPVVSAEIPGLAGAERQRPACKDGNAATGQEGAPAHEQPHAARPSRSQRCWTVLGVSWPSTEAPGGRRCRAPRWPWLPPPRHPWRLRQAPPQVACGGQRPASAARDAVGTGGHPAVRPGARVGCPRPGGRPRDPGPGSGISLPPPGWRSAAGPSGLQPAARGGPGPAGPRRPG